MVRWMCSVRPVERISTEELRIRLRKNGRECLV